MRLQRLPMEVPVGIACFADDAARASLVSSGTPFLVRQLPDAAEGMNRTPFPKDDMWFWP